MLVVRPKKEIDLRSAPADGIVAARSPNEKFGNPRFQGSF
jgi:hypothetical protein